MFTGLVQHMGVVEGLTPIEGGCRLLIDLRGWRHRPLAGESIAVNGACLTVAGPLGDSGLAGFDVVPQTLRLTTLGTLRPGDPVNLEHAATPNTLMGGHIVQGHVDGVGPARLVPGSGSEWRLAIDAPEALRPYLSPQGSVAVDGVSLTIAGVTETGFEVALIPTTREQTTLGRVGCAPRPVNLEVDCVVKAVLHALRHPAWRRLEVPSSDISSG